MWNDGQQIPMSWKLFLSQDRICEILEEILEIIEGVILTLSGAFKSPGGLDKTQTAGPHP